MLNRHYDNIFENELDVEVVDVYEENGLFYHAFNDTIFYVEGGGMPSDIGYINDLKLIDLKECDGKIYHALKQRLEGLVHLKVDFNNRLRNCAIHTAQHLMCGYINKKYQAKTISFFNDDLRAGAEMAFEHLDEATVKEIEAFCNKCIEEDLKVEILYPSYEEASEFVLEEKLEHDTLRAVKIGDIDYNMCACMHVPSLSYLKAFVIESFERTSRGYKLYFVCQDLLINAYHQHFDLLKKLGTTLSCPFDEILESLNKQLSLISDLKHTISEYKEANLNKLCDEFINSEDKIIIKAFKNEDNKDLSRVVSTVVKNSEKAMILLNDLGDRMHLIFARNKAIDIDLVSLSNTFKSLYDLKGGGNPFMIQCGGLKNDELVEHFEDIVASKL